MNIVSYSPNYASKKQLSQATGVDTASLTAKTEFLVDLEIGKLKMFLQI